MNDVLFFTMTAAAEDHKHAPTTKKAHISGGSGQMMLGAFFVESVFCLLRSSSNEGLSYRFCLFRLGPIHLSILDGSM